MAESLLSKADRLLSEYRSFNAQVRQDQANLRNRKTIEIAAPAPAETMDEKMARIHNSKRAAGPADQSVVTAIRVNGQVVADFNPYFIKSNGQEFNLKNSFDRGIFMEKFWPDAPRERWPALFNEFLTRGTITKDEAPVFVRQLKARVV